MRKKNREITDPQEIFAVIQKCDVCRLAFFDEGCPYIVPLNFGASMEGGAFTLYFHGAREGKKMELLAQNPAVGFEMDTAHHLVTADTACGYTMEYESVCGGGVLEQVEGEEKMAALRALMEQYAPGKDLPFDEKIVAVTAVLRLRVQHVTGKRLKKRRQG